MIIDSPIISGSSAASGSLNQFGNVTITGSLTVTGPIIGALTGSVDSASFASTAVSASYAASATSASYAASATSASYANNATTAVTSSYPLNITGSSIYSVQPATSQLNPLDMIALGENAGYQARGAYRSNFLGNYAGSGATNSYNANFLGPDAGRNASNASYSNFLGNGAGQSATNASDSNFLGTSAGFQATNAQNSVFIGNYAGFQASDATYNILIGYKAGAKSSFESSVVAKNIILGNNITLDGGRVGTTNIGAVFFITESYSNVGTSNPFAGAVTTGKVGINKAYPIYNLDVSGSGNFTNGLIVTGSIVATSFTGSLLGTASYAANANLLDGLDSSVFVLSSSFQNYTSSNNATVAQIQNATSSLYAATASIYTATSSIYGATASLFSYTSSNDANIASLNAATASLNQYTRSLNLNSSSFAITGSNTFVGTQYFSNVSNPISFTSTGSFYSDGGARLTKDLYVSGTAYFNNVTVFGTQSVNYITSSQLNIATNIITVNTSTPTVRFGGLAVYDSGSLGTGLTGSLLWDSENNHWIYSNPSGSSYDGGMLISGPRNSSGLGSEQGTTNNALMKGQGGDHITSSAVFEVSGSVGIGTTTPGSKLEIYNSNGDTRATITSTGGTGASDVMLKNASGTVAYEWLVQGLGSDGRFRIYDNAGASTGERFTIDQTGNVGIGTTSPTVKLDVVSSGGSGIRIIDSTSPNVYINNTVVQWKAYMPSSTNNFAINDAVRDVLTLGYNGAASYFQGCNVGIGTTSPSGKLDILGPTSDQLRLRTAGTEYYGIGRNASTGLLEFYGSQTGYTGYVFGGVDGTRMTINSGGSVGIGTTTPSASLHVATTGKALQLGSNATNGGTGVFFAGSSTNKNWFIGNQYNVNDGLEITPSAATGSNTIGTSPLVVLTGGGSVGIGTTAPSFKLDVNGVTRFRDIVRFKIDAWNLSDDGFNRFYFASSGRTYFGSGNGYEWRSDADSALMVLANVGNLGIGTTSPTYKLDVSGNGRFTSTLSATKGYFEDSSGLGSVLEAYNTVATNATTAIIRQTGAGGNGNQDIGLLVDIQGAGNSDRIANFRYYNGSTYTSRLLIQRDGNVGIGTTSPASKLDVSGDIFGRGVIFGYASSTQYGGLSYGVLGSTDGFLFLKTGGTTTVQIQASGSSYFNAGNVSIGTTSPYQKLVNAGHIAFTTATAGTDATADIQRAGIGWQAAASDQVLGSYITAANQGNWGSDIQLFTRPSSGGNAAERMRITSAGNVGISTTSPSALLHVNGSNNAGLSLLVNGSNSSDGTIAKFARGGSEKNFYISATNNQNVNLGTEGAFVFKVGVTADQPYATGASAMVINSSGQVGINTTSPQALVDIYADNPILRLSPSSGNYVFFQKLNTSNGDYLRLYDGTAYTMTWKGGNVGIGTTSPDYKLRVEGASYFTSTMGIDGEGNGLTIDTGYGNNGRVGFMKYGGLEGMLVAGNTTILRLGHRTDSDNVATSGTPTIRVDMHIAANGNIGIGTVSPAYVLDVSGQGRFTGRLHVGEDLALTRTNNDFGYVTRPNTSGYKKLGFLVAGGGNLTDFHVYSDTSYISGNVGIGTTSPSTKLDVYNGVVSVYGGYFLGRDTVTISALNTGYIIYGAAVSGIITARDNTYGGSGAWLLDPNGGTNSITSNFIDGAYTVYYSGGNTYMKKTSGNVPVTMQYVLLAQ